jgi:hypothetical protein
MVFHIPYIIYSILSAPPLQNPTLKCPRTANRALVHWSQGVRRRAAGCMALRWWRQCRKRSLRGSGQHPVLWMPSTHTELCGWWLFNSPVLVGQIRTARNLQEKNGESHQKEPWNAGFSTDSPICGRYHMTTETASHILCECVALAEFRFRRLGKHFYGTKRLWWHSVV